MAAYEMWRARKAADGGRQKWTSMHATFGDSEVAVGPLLFWFVLLCLKHILADFFWQPHWMATGKEQATGWFRPLLIHCLIHGASTTALLLILQPRLWSLGLVDFVIHAIVDRGKGFILCRRHLTPNRKAYWTLLGVDQTLHHLTGFALALAIAATSP